MPSVFRVLWLQDGNLSFWNRPLVTPLSAASLMQTTKDAGISLPYHYQNQCVMSGTSSTWVSMAPRLTLSSILPHLCLCLLQLPPLR
ncbi:hypothetical protein CRENBAI_014603, partial [Crenichthys baileyi]